MNTLSRALLPLLRERECIQIQRCNSGLAFELDRILIWFGLRVHIVLLTHDIFKYRHGSWMYPLHLVCQIHFSSGFLIAGRCENGNPCDQNCYNIHNEMYECDCNQGYILSGNGYSCIGKYSRLSSTAAGC